MKNMFYRGRLLPVAPLRELAAVGFWSDEPEPPSDAPMSRSWRLGLPSSHWLTWMDDDSRSGVRESPTVVSKCTTMA